MSNNMYQCLEGLPESIQCSIHKLRVSRVLTKTHYSIVLVGAFPNSPEVLRRGKWNNLFSLAFAIRAICEYCMEGSGKPSRHPYMLLDMLLTTGFGPVVGQYSSCFYLFLRIVRK